MNTNQDRRIRTTKPINERSW